MNEMVERIARAMQATGLINGVDWPDEINVLVRAAVTAMREPTDEMIKAAWNAPARRQTHWQAMIDEVLRG